MDCNRIRTGLHEVIKNYGEERFSRQIARAIVAQREESPIDTTRKLAQLVAQNVRTRERGQDPATRTFQAVRIFINRELEEVEAVLPQVAGRSKRGWTFGRHCVPFAGRQNCEAVY